MNNIYESQLWLERAEDTHASDINLKNDLLLASVGYRQSVDYDIEAHVSEEECQLLLKNARKFYTLLKYISKN